MAGHFLIIIIGLLVIIGGIAGVALLIALIVRKRSPQAGGDETRVLQDVHQGLEKMEERAQALESALLDEGGKSDESREEFSWSATGRKE